MIRNLRLYLSSILLMLLNNLDANLVYPQNNSELNYTHVLFEWNQIPEADSYNLYIAKDSLFNDVIRIVTVNSLVFIEKENIDWESNYFWKLHPNYDPPFSIEWSDTFTFSTGQKRSDATAVIYNENNFSPGLTLFGSFYNYYSAMIDINGEEVWNTGDKNIVYYNSTPELDLLGCFSDNSLEYNLPGINFDINSNFILG